MTEKIENIIQDNMRNILKISMVILVFLFSCEKEDFLFSEISLKVKERILQNYFITSIAFDSNGVAWIGTFNSGLLSYKNGSLTVFNSENSIINDEVMIWDVKVDNNNNVWIGADGLFKYDGNSFEKFDNTNSPIPENFISSIAIDNDNIVWFSSSRFKQGGLMNYDGNKWELFTPENSQLPCNLISDIVVDNENNKWIALGQTVNEMTMIKITNDNIWNIIIDNEIGFKPYYWGDLVVSNNNVLYASIDYSLSSSMDISRPNIVRCENEKWSIENPIDEAELSLGYVRTINCDNDGNLWAAISPLNNTSKLAIYNGDKWIVNNDDIDIESVFVMKTNNKNETWIGTGDGVVIISH